MSEEEIIKRLISKIEISKTIIETFEELEDFDTCEREQEKIELLQATINLIDKLQKENEELKEQRDNAIKLRNELIEEQKITCISKNKIREFIKEELPDDEIMESCEMFDMNGVYLRKKIEELLNS